MIEFPKSNAVADEHGSSHDTNSDGESHETSNLFTNADLSQNEKLLSRIIIHINNKAWFPYECFHIWGDRDDDMETTNRPSRPDRLEIFWND